MEKNEFEITEEAIIAATESETAEADRKKGGITQILGCILLLVTAMIWGFAFVAQSKGMESVGPFTFNGIRSFVGAIALLPVLIFNRKKIFKVFNARKEEVTEPAQKKKMLLLGIITIGVVFFLATSSQQVGIGLTDSVGKAGFITALYIVLVPLLGIFLKKRPGIVVYGCVLVSAVGLYLLCIPKGSKFTLKAGDLLLVACAILFSAHIMLIDFFTARINGVLIAFCQFMTVGIFSLFGILLFEHPSLESIMKAGLPILYAGVLSSSVGYTLQIIGQKYVEPTRASLIMCMESVFSVLGGWLILKQTLSLREAIGCIVMFVSIIVCQLFGNRSIGKKTTAPSGDNRKE
ncbi:MAG: DMT family transporter [Lachnospiraceae bacterium]|nr:DMT family transporter [Lachnospiraceae bacterium]